MLVVLCSQRIHQINLILFIFKVLYNESILEQDKKTSHVFPLWDLKQNIPKWVHFQWDQNQYPTIGPQIEFTYHHLEWDNKQCAITTTEANPVLPLKITVQEIRPQTRIYMYKCNMYKSVFFLRGETVLPLYLLVTIENVWFVLKRKTNT